MKNTLLYAGLIITILSACQSVPGGAPHTKADTMPAHALKKDTANAATTQKKPFAAAVARAANFEIAIPAGWAVQQKKVSGTDMLFLMAPAEGGYRSNLNVIKDAMKGESLNDYIKISLAKMQGMHVTMGRSGDVEANGVNGKYLKYLYNYNGKIVAVKSYVFAMGGVAYIVTATTIPALGKKYEPVFDEAVNTLKIN